MRCSGGPHTGHSDLEATITDNIRYSCSLGKRAGVEILTVTFPCFTAFIQDFYSLMSGATGNCHVFTIHWSQLYLPICTYFIETVFSPSLIANPTSFVLEIITLTFCRGC